jgi:sRNA-binding regulator protein Hfq
MSKVSEGLKPSVEPSADSSFALAAVLDGAPPEPAPAVERVEAKPLSGNVRAGNGRAKSAISGARKLRTTNGAGGIGSVRRFSAVATEDYGHNRQAELFYLQKQIQQQTQMVFILEDGARVQGVVERYDRHSIKVRGKSRALIYKSAIKYLYKAGENGEE